MIRYVALATAFTVSGCTVAWQDLRAEASPSPPGWRCPSALSVEMTSGHETNTFGPKQDDPQRTKERESEFRKVAERVLQQHNCTLGSEARSASLKIKIEDMEQLSALPQEWLTGLSLGLIPSWGTRPAELRFSFSQGTRSASYVVDDKRINHLVLFPVFWVSFLLMDEKHQFEVALNEFTAGL